MSRATVCIAFGSPDQFKNALERDVPPLLNRAKRQKLDPELIVVGGGNIGTFENSKQLDAFKSDLDMIRNVDTTVVASFSDLPILRFYSSIGLGELCRVEDAMLEELVDVLGRVPAIKGIEDVPSIEYRDHIKDCDSMARYFLAIVKREPDVSLKPLFTLAMFSKAVNMSWRTAGVSVSQIRSIIESVPEAVAMGLLAVLPVNGVAPSTLSFLGCHLVDEENRPGELRNPKVAEVAGLVLERVFEHAERVHAVLKRSKLATLVHDHAPLVDAGPKDAFLKLIYARKIESMRTIPSGFELKTSISKTWIQDINDDLGNVLFALEQPSGGDESRAFRAVAKKVAPKLAALTSIVSPYFTIDSAMLASSMADVLLSNRKFSVIAHSNSYASHVVNQLQVKECAIDVSACVLHVGKHPRSQATILSIFPRDDSIKPATRPPEASQENIKALHKQLKNVARSLDRPSSPIGSLTGTVTGRFEFDGNVKRCIIWKKRGGPEIMASVHDAATLELKFLDYETGSIDGTSVGLNRVEEDFEIRSKTRLRLSSLDPASGVFSLGQEGNVSVEFDLVERPGDRISGLQVQWARRGPAWVLVSDNSLNERLVV